MNSLEVAEVTAAVGLQDIYLVSRCKELAGTDCDDLNVFRVMKSVHE